MSDQISFSIKTIFKNKIIDIIIIYPFHLRVVGGKVSVKISVSSSSGSPFSKPEEQTILYELSVAVTGTSKRRDDPSGISVRGGSNTPILLSANAGAIIVDGLVIPLTGPITGQIEDQESGQTTNGKHIKIYALGADAFKINSRYIFVML